MHSFVQRCCEFLTQPVEHAASATVAGHHSSPTWKSQLLWLSTTCHRRCNKGYDHALGTLVAPAQFCGIGSCQVHEHSRKKATLVGTAAAGQRQGGSATSHHTAQKVASACHNENGDSSASVLHTTVDCPADDNTAGPVGPPAAVPAQRKKRRLDDACVQLRPDLSKNVLQSFIAQGRVYVDGQQQTKAGFQVLG